MAAPVRHLTIAGIALALAGPTSVHTSRFRGMYAVARLDRNDQFNELLPFAAIDVEPCECSASTDPEPLPDKLRFAVDGDGVIAAGAEAWFAALREGAAAVLREGAAAVLRAGAAAVPVFVGDLVCGSAFRLAKDDDPWLAPSANAVALAGEDVSFTPVAAAFDTSPATLAPERTALGALVDAVPVAFPAVSPTVFLTAPAV